MEIIFELLEDKFVGGLAKFVR